jgi:hypothetical protein
MLMPAFQRFPKEAAIIGRLLAGYGEVDFTLAMLAAKICGDEETILRAIFRMRTEGARLDLADTLIGPKLEPYPRLAGRYSYAIGCANWCRNLRNQYAHCHWSDDDSAGLFFTNLEKAADKASGFHRRWLHVDVPLLEKQEEYFIHTRRCLWHLTSEWLAKIGEQQPYLWPMPKRVPEPRKHNLEAKHRAPWPSAVPTPPPKERPRRSRSASRKT